MNWWTAEYGLIGSLEAPKIFGAGLLSSVGESKWCLSNQVKKIPLTLECVKQTYDITEPQPQLFVAENFHHLSDVLKQLSETMAYKTGGRKALDKLIQAKIDADKIAAAKAKNDELIKQRKDLAEKRLQIQKQEEADLENLRRRLEDLRIGNISDQFKKEFEKIKNKNIAHVENVI